MGDSLCFQILSMRVNQDRLFFPEAPNGDGWFVVGKMLKELLIEANFFL